MVERSGPVIDVRLEPGLEGPAALGGHPVLTYEERLPFGRLWVLSYLDNPCSPDAGVDEHLIPGDLDDLERVYDEAQAYLRRRRLAS
jgi:hypothetical protein